MFLVKKRIFEKLKRKIFHSNKPYKLNLISCVRKKGRKIMWKNCEIICVIIREKTRTTVQDF